MFKNKVVIAILLNRLVSLCVDYGYLILLGIIFANYSISMIMFLWIAKTVGDLLALKVKGMTVLNYSQPKYVLMGCEMMKGLLLASIFFLKDTPMVFIIVVLIEVINTIFGSNLTSIRRLVIDKKDINKFNSTYTSVGSISYFLAPIIVGGSLFTNNTFNLFLVYALVTIGSSIFLLSLPNNLEMRTASTTQSEEKSDIKNLMSI